MTWVGRVLSNAEGGGRAAGAVSVGAVEGDGELVGAPEHGGFVDEDDAARLQYGGADVCLVEAFEGFEAEAGHVETIVLAGFHRFNVETLVGAQGAGAPDHLVGAFIGFDGEHGAFSDDTALADVESGAFAGDVQSVRDVFAVDADFFPGHRPGAGEVLVDEGAGVEEVYADGLDLVGDGAEDGLGVATLEGGEDGERLEVRVQAGKEATRRDLAGHDGVAGVEAFERFEQGADLADFDQGAVGFGEGVLELGCGLALHGDEAQGHAGGAGLLGDECGVAALAGDEGDGAAGIKIRRQVGGEFGHGALHRPGTGRGWQASAKSHCSGAVAAPVNIRRAKTGSF